MNRIEIATLKVGDEVAWGRYGNYGLSEYGFGKVTKITATGQVTVESVGGARVRRFNKDGYEHGATSKYSALLLIDPASVRAQIAEREVQRATNQKFDAIRQAIEGCRTGGGNYHVTEERKAELLKLVEAL